MSTVICSKYWQDNLLPVNHPERDSHVSPILEPTHWSRLLRTLAVLGITVSLVCKALI